MERPVPLARAFLFVLVLTRWFRRRAQVSDHDVFFAALLRRICACPKL